MVLTRRGLYLSIHLSRSINKLEWPTTSTTTSSSSSSSSAAATSSAATTSPPSPSPPALLTRRIISTIHSRRRGFGDLLPTMRYFHARRIYTNRGTKTKYLCPHKFYVHSLSPFLLLLPLLIPLLSLLPLLPLKEQQWGWGQDRHHHTPKHFYKRSISQSLPKNYLNYSSPSTPLFSSCYSSSSSSWCRRFPYRLAPAASCDNNIFMDHRPSRQP